MSGPRPLRLDVTPARLRLESEGGFRFEYRRRDTPRLLVLAAAWLALGLTLGVQLAGAAHARAEGEALATLRRQAAVLERQQRAGRDQQELLAFFHRALAIAFEGRSSYPATKEPAP